MKQIFLLLGILFGTNMLLKAQLYRINLLLDSTASKEEKVLAREIHNRISLPRSLDTTCRSLVMFISLTIDNAKIEKLNFSTTCTEDFKDAFRRIAPFLQEQNWQSIMSLEQNMARFKILIPYMYSFEADGCYDRITDRNHSYIIKQEETTEKKNGMKVFTLKPIMIRITSKRKAISMLSP